ncbi:MAG: transposase [Bacteroidota bacterium]
MATSREPFEFDCYYHVFNHARGNDNIFESEKDNQSFLELISKYIDKVAQIYAYCLMPNHFHILCKIKEVELPSKFEDKHESDYISHQWGNVQNTYSKKKNFSTGKRGGLFCQSINRNLITSEDYLQMCIAYIHNNPVTHGFCGLPENWKFSSYKAIISDQPTKIQREEVLYWFENKKNFIEYHKTNAADIFATKFNIN